MNNRLLNIIDDIDPTLLEDFVSNTKSNFEGTISTKKTMTNTDWIETIDEKVQYIDLIIRNPRRFIVQEEEIVPVEKAKVVTEETIKHLATHTQFIQYVDENDLVTPSKLLNIYREETTDLYENRFIKSLIDQLYIFVKQKEQTTESLDSKIETVKEANYEADTKINGFDYSVNIGIKANKTEILSDLEEQQKIEEKRKHIESILSEFMSSVFYKELLNAEPVRSPIRKTNTILKDQNFRRCVELWEYIEANITRPGGETNEIVEDIKPENKDFMDLSYYISKYAIDEKNQNKTRFNSYEFGTIIREAIFDDKISVKRLEKMFRHQLNKVVLEKTRQEQKIKEFYLKKLSIFDEAKEKALDYL